MNAPAEITRRICEACAIGDMDHGSTTCRLCRLHELVAALEYYAEGASVAAAFRKAEAEFQKQPANADTRKYRRAFPQQEIPA